MDHLWIFLQIIAINVLLSGDNALVIAMASQHLPPEQRKRAIAWGTFAAIALRCVLTLAAISLLQLPYLQACGSALLLVIAVQLLRDAERPGEERRSKGAGVKRAGTLAGAVGTIVAADFVMSLDNVLAVAAVAGGEPALMLLGIALSIPMILWGSQLLGGLLLRFPSLVYAGAGLLGYAAGEMLVSDAALQPLLRHAPLLHGALPVLMVPAVIAAGILLTRSARRS
ncbi:TerC family protein [Paenibacillus pasadenensis]|uniref:Integral membrane protein TerC n=1 Tax=Paenibacillus pasadenensis TaxID=217090 RepID=A0A2N5N869_9BACL|nr:MULTISPECIES: TerC family protein [Paenibacillus]PLT46513.1 Integral membrane protein TerC [Paenibacillus pasadenensis]QGG56919.1 YjbE family putative metal transport protein [Paenibacillus sp. B01]